MVGAEEDDGVVDEVAALEGGEELADFFVEVAEVGEVGAAGSTDVVGSDVVVLVVVGDVEALGVGVLLFEGEGGDGRFEGGAVGVEVPEAAAADIGVVGVGEADGEAPGAVVGAAGELVDSLDGEVCDFVVVFHLVGGFGDAGVGDGAEVVVPPVYALAGFAVVGGPAEVGGVDVGGEAFFEAV